MDIVVSALGIGSLAVDVRLGIYDGGKLNGLSVLSLSSDNDDLNRKLPSFKQIKTLEIRTEPFEKTTSRKIKRHLVK